MKKLWLALCLLCMPLVASAEQLVFHDRVNALVTQWDYSGPGWTHGTFAARLRWPAGIAVSTHGTSGFWLRSTRTGGSTFGEIAILSAYDADDRDEYSGILDVFFPAPYMHATRELSIYARPKRLSSWHNYIVKWQPGSVTWLMDGVVKARTTWSPGDGSPWHVLDNESLVPSIKTDSYHSVLVSWIRIWQ